MTIAQEEIFGPVLCVIPYKSIDHAVEMANDNEYGLACGVWGKNVDRAQTVARRLRAGTAWINDYHVFNDYGAFGGYKKSGIGRELGHHGLAEYTEIKHIHIGTEGDPDAKAGPKLLLKRKRSIGYEYEPTTRIISGPGSVARLTGELAAARQAARAGHHRRRRDQGRPARAHQGRARQPHRRHLLRSAAGQRARGRSTAPRRSAASTTSTACSASAAAA